MIIEFTVQGVRVYPRELSDLALGKIADVMGVRESFVCLLLESLKE